MIAYFLVGLSIPLMAYMLKNIKRNLNHTFFLICTGLVLVLFSGLRGDFCTDYKSYYDFFSLINSNYSFSSIWHGSFYNEKGFVFFNKIVGLLTDKPEVFMFLLSFLIILFFFLILNRYSESAWLSVLLFVGVGSFYDSFNVTRQILAASIAFLGSKFLFEKNFWRYSICIIISSLFHRTAILLIPLYFVLVSKITKKKIFYYCIIGTIGYFLISRIIDVVRLIIPAYRYYNDFSGGGSIKWLVLPLAFLLFTGFVFFSKKVDEEVIKRADISVSLNALFLYVFFVIVGMQSQMVVRMATFMQPYTWLLIPNLLENYKESKEKLIIIVLITLLSILYPMITLWGTGYDPYYMILAN